jgi:ethanolamine ammonia-lyase small subunit
VSTHSLLIQTKATDRDDYLAHPPRGEVIREDDAGRVRGLYPLGRPGVQVVISDGLNPNALNENLRLVLPGVRRQLTQAGHHVGGIDIIIVNGRVRAGYHVGMLLDVEVLIHFIGERPGTGIDTMSAYLTYGRDKEGQSRWGSDVDHSWTTAVCGISRKAKRPAAAADEIAALVNRMFEARSSGVALS